ncbi:MAG: fatty acid desaturase [Parafilimonas sp.]
MPKHIFKPSPQRLIWFFVHSLILILSVYFILTIDSWMLRLLLSIIVGHSFACVFFLGHEIAHGTVVKDKKLIIFFSTICFAPFGLHGKGWVYAHNGKHHLNTQHSVKDPDCFGNKKYRYNKILQRMTKFLPGSGSPLSYLFMFWYFSFYAIYIVWIYKPSIFTNRRDKIESRLFLILVYALWILFSALAMPFGFLYLFLIPLLISNFVVMSYISTNHFLNPLTSEVNDSLVNSLTVKTYKIFNVLHMNFSYHVEHHVFPYVNPKYAPLISRALKEKFPNEYNEMSQAKAIKLLYQRPKFYHDEVTLINPENKQKYPTIILDDII